MRRASLLTTRTSLRFAVAFLAGGCSSSPPADRVGIPVEVVPPGVTFPDGQRMGGSCRGDVYLVGAGNSNPGYLVCDSGSWGYTQIDPSTDGFTLDTNPSDDAGLDGATDASGDVGLDGPVDAGTASADAASSG